MTSTERRPQHSRRLPPQQGEVIDRNRVLEFSWNGRRRSGYEGDTIISALAAAGEDVFSRSFKYHRPRGVLTATMHDPGCMLQVDDEPNVRAAHRLLRAGMRVSSQNTWPSLHLDLKAATQLGGRFLAPGFYYKTFMWPRVLWPVYERVLRQFVHAGRVEPQTRGEVYEKRNAHTDVLVVGGGPAGMAAALSAVQTGARVMLVEEEHQLGGHLRWADPAAAADLARQVLEADGIEVLTNATVAARYDGNWCAVVQRDPEPGMPERILKTRTQSLVVAPGLIERPYVFAGNDLPGVMLSSAARRLIGLHAVAPGERAVVLTANPEGDAAVEDLRRAGIEVAQVVDARTGGDVLRARGRKRLQAVELADGTTVEADLLVTATGWTAPTSLLNMSGVVPNYVPQAARFLPGAQPGAGIYGTGGLVGDGELNQLQNHGAAVGSHAAQYALQQRHAIAATVPTSLPAGGHPNAGTAPPMSSLPIPQHPELFRSSTHGIVDFSEDVSSRDLQSAVREGYDSAELAKRYTTVTMGPSQGKLELVNALAVIAEANGKTIAETGATTWRPMYTSVTLGALAGRNYDPVRYSELQPWHESHGAVPLVAGQWIRPERYGDPLVEVNSVRQGVGIIDVTPIGKLDLRGPDVPKLLNQLYVNKWSRLAVGRVRYGVMCAEDGVVFDDGVTARLDEEHYVMSTTSSGAGAVWEWVEEWLQTMHPDWQVHVTPLTTAYTSINVAGPHSRRLLSRLTAGVDLSAEAFGYMQVRTGRVAGVDDSILWRIGFTGELSYEIHVPASYGLHVWEALLHAGEDLGVRPFGVEAQRVLRLEKGHLIIGQDTDGLTKAYSAGLDWAVKLDKDDFAGKPELVWQREQGAGPQLVAIQPVDPRTVPEEAAQIILPTGRIGGRITSSRHSPTLGRSICLGQVERALSDPGTVLKIRLTDGRTVEGTVMPQLAHVDPEGNRLNNDTLPEETVEYAAPVARGPVVVQGQRTSIDDWQVSASQSSAPLTLADVSPLAKISVRAAPDGPIAESMPTGFGRVSPSGDGRLVVGSGPGEWMVLAEPGERAAVLDELREVTQTAEEHASVVDLTHGRALFQLMGESAPDLLAAVCAIDLSDDMVSDGAALRTSMAGVVTDLIRYDRGGIRRYLLHCERSSGRYLHSTLLDAGRSSGVTESGYPVSGPVLNS
ncbi:2Fe-2S iron-sulfur cluster-binding protein [Nesterenkonia natronophila]|uniref:FAD-dependent oxidoreductase n=1 Tax=Nesterenkonia natronophila TaxID=2174932 RepID=A0A3A4G1J4_9MICC|nr:2Fe-2S iron-sulfur cluster-binding protein [Nesterenkonia natronophila]RJN31929.1 FAD-dependent oxidoreductase [Nesterenkonia natronophila]